MRRIFWDTMLFAYLFDAHPTYGPRVRKIYNAMTKRRDTLLSSTVILGEVIVGPYKTSSLSGIDRVESLFSSSEIALLPYPPEATRIFAKLRAIDGVKAMDALHLATAAHAGVDLFLTNDRRLNKLAIPGIQFIAGLDTDLF